MEKKKFIEQYRSKWWIETSKRIKSRDHNTCQMCGCNDKPLSVHHLHYGDDGSLDVADDFLVTLCEDCHKEQKEYRVLCNEIIEEIRQQMTDVELYQIFNFVLNYYCPDNGDLIWKCDFGEKCMIPDECIIDMDGNEVKKIHNIRKWRKNVMKERLLKMALWQYYVSKKENDEKTQKLIEDWFDRKYGETITNYMETHKEESMVLEENVKQHFVKFNIVL